MRLVIITGLSGSGKTTAARALEDDGFFVVDNLPPALLRSFLAVSAASGDPRELAVVIDARNRDFFDGFDLHLQAIADEGHQIDILFFDAQDETLVRRYSETRRRHPLALGTSVAEGIAAERKLLAPLRDRATRLIDSTGMTPHQLRAQIVHLLRGGTEQAELNVRLQSFGFRYGLPCDSDLVIDVRFLPNPHFVPELRPLSGLDATVSDYVLGQEESREFVERFMALLAYLLPQYRREGKSYLTLSIGCTGGRHRSVAIAAHLAELLEKSGLTVSQTHRDIEKG